MRSRLLMRSSASRTCERAQDDTCHGAGRMLKCSRADLPGTAGVLVRPLTQSLK